MIDELNKIIGINDDQVILALSLLGTLLAVLTAYFILTIIRRRQTSHVATAITHNAITPILCLLGLLGIKSALNQFDTNEKWLEYTNHGLSLALIATGGWLAISIVRAAADVWLSRYDINKADNYRARKMHTQLRVLARVLYVLLAIITLALMLMTFDGVAGLGASLLASAGVTGIIIGFAAQKTLGTIFAGIQIAITQPIKIDDAVVVEGEWGWIEEITFTYVVIRIWDLRRLIVPITYFIETPFQNWTRKTAEVIGTVVLHVDYSFPVEEMRNELDRLLESSDLWNKNVKVLQVIDTTEKTMTLRALMTAKDSPTTWDLRCYVREGLIKWMQENYPASLPKMRIEMEAEGNSNNKNSKSDQAAPQHHSDEYQSFST